VKGPSIKSSLSRRSFLSALTAGSVSALGKGLTASVPVQIFINTSRRLNTIPADFIGLGYEISSVSIPGLLSARNQRYVQLVRTLGPSGVIRIGGNTSDYASFTVDGHAVSAPKGTLVNAAGFKQLAGFLDATGWKLIWGLNLGSNDERQVIAEATAVSAAVGEKLLAFEIGNEPDLFGHGTAHRPSTYNFDDYLREYRSYKAAIRAKLPNAPFAGPDVAVATDWVSSFAAGEASDLKLLTHHYYRQCVGPTSTLERLLYPDPKIAPEMEKLRAVSSSSKLPYRICEANSFCGGGQPGVSDTFGAALWVLDFMFNLASYACAGVNIETGVNHLGFVSSYSPIADDSAKAAYYGMLAFEQGSKGQRITADYDARGINLTAYAVMNGSSLSVTIINKDFANNAAVEIRGLPGFNRCEAIRLTAPSLQSKDKITLGGASVDSNGKWSATIRESVPGDHTRWTIQVPAGSAAILTWRSDLQS
jgi:hypothetical protein